MIIDDKYLVEGSEAYEKALVRSRCAPAALLRHAWSHATNYDMSAWQAQTVVSLLERDHAARVFNIWTLNRSVELLETTESWRVPSLAILRGATLGTSDFAVYD